MSFVVLFNSDCAPIDIKAHTGIEFDRQNFAIFGKFRQTAFMWTDEAPDAPTGATATPADLDGRIWIIGRIRLDNRDALCAAVRAPQTDDDKLLCLRSYAKWAHQSLEHLQGDFCFAIWDEDRQQLLCARDQLGVKPLFYARIGNSWRIGDALESIRSCSTLKGDLDDYWVADFLTTGFCLDFHRTVYKEISRLPPAHVLIASSDDNVARRYWTLNIETPIFYRHESEYLDHFHELLALSIGDRLPEDCVGVSMSGGVDSSTLAAKAVAVTGDSSRVVSDTSYFEHLISDDEKHFSSLVARCLGIRHRLRPIDDIFYDRHWEARDIQTPEPTRSIINAVHERNYGAEMEKEAKVWFFGEGPDNALKFEWRAYLRWLWVSGDFPQFSHALVGYLRSKQAHEWRTSISTRFSRRSAAEIDPPAVVPGWMEKAFVEKVDLTERLRRAEFNGGSMHPWHPCSIASFTSAIWSGFFDAFDTAVSGNRIEWRHPYLDLRVLTFLLSVPPIPWARRKLLIREAMQGVLPKEVLSRQKAPLTEDPVAKIVKKYPLPSVSLETRVCEFVNEGEVPSKPANAAEAQDLIKIRALNFWLRNR